MPLVSRGRSSSIRRLDAGQHAAQRLGALREGQAELGQQAADAVERGGALFHKALAGAVHQQLALLLDALDGYETHVRPGDGFADGGGIVGVVAAENLAPFAPITLTPDATVIASTLILKFPAGTKMFV